MGLMVRGHLLLSALCFSSLLNFKHIYLYCAPAFFIYILTHYVFADTPSSQKETDIEEGHTLRKDNGYANTRKMVD